MRDPESTPASGGGPTTKLGMPSAVARSVMLARFRRERAVEMPAATSPGPTPMTRPWGSPSARRGRTSASQRAAICFVVSEGTARVRNVAGRSKVE